MKKMKLTKTTGDTFKCVLPKDLVKQLGWDGSKKLSVKKYGNKLILTEED